MQSLTYVSDCGMTVQFSERPPFVLGKADLNSAAASFDETKPMGTDGAKTHGGQYEKKAIVIEGNIVGRSFAELEKMRGLLAMTLNVHVSGELLLSANGGENKSIRCRPIGNPDFPETFGLSQPYTVQLQCDSPYWLASQKTIVPIGQIKPLWHFPFTPPVQFGRAISKVKIINSTSIEIPLVIEVLSQATLVALTNRQSGQTFRINAVIAENKKMVIDGINCDVEIVDLLTEEHINATNKLVAGGDFISLSPGLNEIEITNGIADSAPLSYIFYNVPSLAV